ncbi:hypothetical protein HK097_004716, partial [Rhizophlyctis rosea]
MTTNRKSDNMPKTAPSQPAPSPNPALQIVSLSRKVSDPVPKEAAIEAANRKLKALMKEYQTSLYKCLEDQGKLIAKINDSNTTADQKKAHLAKINELHRLAQKHKESFDRLSGL